MGPGRLGRRPGAEGRDRESESAGPEAGAEGRDQESGGIEVAMGGDKGAKNMSVVAGVENIGRWRRDWICAVAAAEFCS
jgi:hypothetical protein